jgi:hypothetical protein
MAFVVHALNAKRHTTGTAAKNLSGLVGGDNEKWVVYNIITFIFNSDLF